MCRQQVALLVMVLAAHFHSRTREKRTAHVQKLIMTNYGVEQQVTLPNGVTVVRTYSLDIIDGF